jgi:hypothetical protein
MTKEGDTIPKRKKQREKEKFYEASPLFPL